MKQDLSLLKFQFLNAQDVDEAAKLLGNSFVALNSIWRKLKIPKEDAEECMKQRIMLTIKPEWTSIMKHMETNKIIMVSVAFDLVDYVQNRDKIGTQFQWWKDIREVARELEDQYIGSLNAKRGQFIYADVGAIDSEFTKQKYTKYFWQMAILHLKYCGFKGLLGRASNPVSTIILTKLGGKVIKRVYLKGLENEYMDLIRLDFDQLKTEPFSNFQNS